MLEREIGRAEVDERPTIANQQARLDGQLDRMRSSVCDALETLCQIAGGAQPANPSKAPSETGDHIAGALCALNDRLETQLDLAVTSIARLQVLFGAVPAPTTRPELRRA